MVYRLNQIISYIYKQNPTIMKQNNVGLSAKDARELKDAFRAAVEEARKERDERLSLLRECRKQGAVLRECCQQIGVDAGNYYLEQGIAGSWRLMTVDEDGYTDLVYEDPGCHDLNGSEEDAAALFAYLITEHGLG